MRGLKADDLVCAGAGKKPRLVSRRGRIAVGTAVVLVAFSGAASAAEATDYIVTNLEDSGPGSLRQATEDANANMGPDDIFFDPTLSGTLTMSPAEMELTGATDVFGPPGQVTLTPSAPTRAFAINTAAGEDVFISRLRFHDFSSGAMGGAIVSFDADLTLADTVFESNESTDGGALGLGTGTLAVRSSTFAENSSRRGGALTLLGSAAIEGSTFVKNSVGGTVDDSDDGGAIFAGFDKGLQIRNSTFTGNMAESDGGAVFHNGAFGPNQVILKSTTIAGNSAGLSGGGMYAYTDPGLTQPPRLSNTIVADNTAIAGPDLSGAFDAGFLLLKRPTGATITPNPPGSNVTGQEPRLGPLAANGGPTQTLAPLQDSPALDRGSSDGLSTDQRGLPRPFDYAGAANSSASGGDGADIGAVELQRPELPRPLGTCRGRSATVPPGEPGEIIAGTEGNDVVVGTGGPDAIRTLGGNDLICAGAGNDVVQTGAGRDQIYGEGGTDRLFGQAGRDSGFGAAGSDLLAGSLGADRLFGQAGRDRLLGAQGNDLLSGGGAGDVLLGAKGADNLKGGPGKDRLSGGAGTDRLKGGPGKDSEQQ